MREGLAGRQRAGHRVQWAAGIAAVLIAAIVIATLALARFNTRSHAVPAATPTPTTQATPTPLGNVLSVPDSTPIIIYGDPAKAGQLDGITWDGKTSGRLANQRIVGVANAQYSLFGGADSIEDRSGKTVMTGSFGAKGFAGRWADDGTHFCYTTPFSTPNSEPTTLVLAAVGQAPRLVAQIGTLYNQTAVSVAACSVTSDRAVVVQSGGQGIGTAQFWVVQLSTGHVIWTYRFDPAQINVQIVASRDGMYVAADVSQNRPEGTTIFGPDGSVAAHMQRWVEQFSWDGSIAVVDDGPGTANISLIAWRTGQVVWSCPPGYSSLAVALPQPGGHEMALSLVRTADSPTLPDLYVLDGSDVMVFRITY